MKSPHELTPEDIIKASKLQDLIMDHLQAMTNDAETAEIDIDMFLTLLMMTAMSQAYGFLDSQTDMLDIMAKEARRVGLASDKSIAKIWAH